MAGEIDDAAGLRLFGDDRAGGHELLARVGEPALSIDDEIGAPLAGHAVHLASCALDADRRARFAGEDELTGEGVGDEGHAGQGFGIAAEHKLEGGPAAREDDHVLVARLRLVGLAQRRGHHVGEHDLPAARLAEGVEQRRMAALDHVAQARQEAVAVAELADPRLARPVLERFVDPVRRRRIALEDHDLPVAGLERQGGKKAAHAGAQDQNGLSHGRRGPVRAYSGFCASQVLASSLPCMADFTIQMRASAKSWVTP